jgi:hypothetical protein
MLRNNDPQKLVRKLLRAMPEIPYVTPKRTSIAPWVLGVLGVAIVGGITAAMILSPRTRYRTLDIARSGFGKMRGQRGVTEKLGTGGARTMATEPSANGLGGESGANYSSSGV